MRAKPPGPKTFLQALASSVFSPSLLSVVRKSFQLIVDANDCRQKRSHTKCGMGTRLPLGDGRKCRLSFLCIPVPVRFLEDLAILFANIAHFAFGGGDGKSSFCLD